MDPSSTTLFTARLARENHDDVISALVKLGESPRKEFETAIPELAAILELVKVEQLARQNRAVAAQSQRLVRWQCPTCKATFCGYPARSDALFRRCYKKTSHREDGTALECGTEMTVIFDEDAESSSEMQKWTQPAWMERD